ncbi:hypothetical protein EDB81DRAFT_318885 [Dactylonectria macrodidyma]|uniref:Uncharacterized protein n=1 Tax=Dactylonectria macrodidyma TaxID=307937 RepID=A0A9P9I9N7_9HYPO|nr:hypothetical protein EDB81DRAFT_318885 [Dactylonectria macrodidyma]
MLYFMCHFLIATFHFLLALPIGLLLLLPGFLYLPLSLHFRPRLPPLLQRESFLLCRLLPSLNFFPFLLQSFFFLLSVCRYFLQTSLGDFYWAKSGFLSILHTPYRPVWNMEYGMRLVWKLIPYVWNTKNDVISH